MFNHDSIISAMRQNWKDCETNAWSICIDNTIDIECILQTANQWQVEYQSLLIANTYFSAQVKYSQVNWWVIKFNGHFHPTRSM